MDKLLARFGALSLSQLDGMRRGIEKESLRVRADGQLALTPHPPALGSALTHPSITTDYSESLLELITGVHASAAACMEELQQIHQFVHSVLGDELMWAGSMPCALPARDDDIPLGRYGSSHIGRMKTIYRMGLGWRYGRRMQTIAGIHYNWSLPGVGNEGYFDLIRNFRRHSFLLLWLFGASPAVGASFVEGRRHALQPHGEGTMYLPHATSLRMGRLGYQSEAQTSLRVSYNCLDSYAASLHDALTQPYGAYEAIGLRDATGEYRQLATTLLQIENEFYGTIRPKRVIRRGERPLHALRERGVEYVEVRCLDLNPLLPMGIEESTLHFLDVFLLHCLLSESPEDSPEEIDALSANQHRVAERGREPGLLLQGAEQEDSARAWAQRLLTELTALAAALDARVGGQRHALAVQRACAMLDDPARLPSSRVLQSMAQNHGNQHEAMVLALSRQHQDQLRAEGLSPAVTAAFQQAAAASLQEQTLIEQQDEGDFEAFRQAYLAPERLGAS